VPSYSTTVRPRGIPRWSRQSAAASRIRSVNSSRGVAGSRRWAWRVGASSISYLHRIDVALDRGHDLCPDRAELVSFTQPVEPPEQFRREGDRVSHHAGSSI